MDIEIAVSGGGGEGLRRLREWLVAENELRGRVRAVHRPPAPDELGAMLDILVATVPAVLGAGAGAVAGALAQGLTSWLRTRTSDVTIRLRRPDGTEREVSMTQITRTDPRQLSDFVRELARWVDSEPREAVPEPERVDG